MKESTTMPVLFAGHGSPMNAIEDNGWSRPLSDLGRRLPRPRAVLAVSAHWFGPGLRVGGAGIPRTIHDFGGFPARLHAVEYPAQGDPDLADRVAIILGGDRMAVSRDRGLDHGVWSVLIPLFPSADVPVVPLSVDAALDASGQVALGAKLSGLREEGVLLVASGNVTHNLGEAFSAMRTGDRRVPTWAEEHDRSTRTALVDRDTATLVGLLDTPSGRVAHPSPDHWYPLLVAYGASRDSDRLTFPVEGFDLGSLSMRSCLWA